MDKTYLKPEEAARYLGSARSTLAKLRVQGGGPVYMRIGRAIRYRKSDLDAWLERTLVQSTSDYKQQIASNCRTFKSSDAVNV